MISPFEAVIIWYNSLEEKEVKSFVVTFAEPVVAVQVN